MVGREACKPGGTRSGQMSKPDSKPMLDKQTSISFNLVSVKINYPSAVAFVYIYKGAPEHVSVQGYNSSKWIFPLHTVF